MRIRVQLFATLSRYLPGDQGNHGATLDVPEGSTVRDVLARLGIPGEVSAIALLNGRDAGYEEALKEGDTLTMFPPLAGGAGGGAGAASSTGAGVACANLGRSSWRGIVGRG